MEALQTSNKRILFNLLPAHVATHFLDAQFRSNLVSKVSSMKDRNKEKFLFFRNII